MTPWGIFNSNNDESTETPPETSEQQPQEGNEEGVWTKLRKGLQKTRQKVGSGIRSLLTVGRSLDDELIEEVEERLYVADVGPRKVMELADELRDAYQDREIESPEEVVTFLEEKMTADLHEWNTALHLPDDRVGVILVTGVNGSGKTTSIGKLAHTLQQQGKEVLLAASDTFRAAAVEQLTIWADRAGTDIVKNETGDPAAVSYDAAEKAEAGDYDVLIVDTAGRLHTRGNLMDELRKISRVLGDKIEGAPHETLMVLDATTGQNALNQAEKFDEALGLTGLILAILDGTAKGGVVVGMRDKVDIPVKFVGVGEEIEDLAPFDPDRFVRALFE